MTTATRSLDIRALEPDRESPAIFAALARLLTDAYPVMRITTADGLARYAESLRDSLADPAKRWIIAERDGALAGAMRLYDYEMNVRGRDARSGGVGSVAVSLEHKRRGIARALIAWYLGDYRARGATFALLHAFRNDFYRALGFGYGTPVHRFCFAPAALRDDGARGTARFLGEADVDAMLACSERVRASTNGLVARHRSTAERALADTALRYVGVDRDGELRGFMQTAVEVAEGELRNRDELVVRDLTYEDEASLAALLGYLRSQRDQFARIAIETQDAAFYLAATDPRDGSDLSVAPPAAHRVAQTGLGIMYRILDVEAALGHLPVSAAPFTLEVSAADELLRDAGGTATYRFGPHGAPRRDASGVVPDARLSIGIADLASLVMGSLRLRDAVRHRVATLEPRAMLERADAAFATPQPPQCTTRF
jgi:predicted acetyltransferase